MEILGKVTAAAGNTVTVEISGREICSQCGIASDSQLALGCNFCSLVEDKKQKYLQAGQPAGIAGQNGRYGCRLPVNPESHQYRVFHFYHALAAFFPFLFFGRTAILMAHGILQASGRDRRNNGGFCFGFYPPGFFKG
jgi:hypothetical protein